LYIYHANLFENFLPLEIWVGCDIVAKGNRKVQTCLTNWTSAKRGVTVVITGMGGKPAKQHHCNRTADTENLQCMERIIVSVGREMGFVFNARYGTVEFMFLWLKSQKAIVYVADWAKRFTDKFSPLGVGQGGHSECFLINRRISVNLYERCGYAFIRNARGIGMVHVLFLSF
jgi:hypothetical protein